MKYKYCLLVFFVFSFCPASGQDQIGVNPPSMKWSKMETPAGAIIYPRGMDSTAFSIAYRINSAYLFDTLEVLYNQSSKRIPTIIQNQSIFPEGYATPIPWRQELYLTPPQNLIMGATVWKDGLTTHEYRHAQQFMAYNKELTYLYKGLMGNTGWLLSTVLNVPLWYREGDAVDSETRFTNGGRGTLPAFNMEYRTLRLNDIKFNYEKAMSASNFKDFVPNMYRSGYYMSTRLRDEFDDDSWAHVLNNSSKIFFYSFTRALQKITGETSPEFYSSTFNKLDSIWTATDTIENIIGQRVTEKGKTFERYRFPQIDNRNNLIVSHQSFTNIRGFYHLNHDSNLTKIKTAGIYASDHYNFVVEGSLLTWAEASYNPRYQNKTFSIIKIKDLETGKTKQVSHRSRLFNPATSKDGKFVAAIEYDETELSSIKIIDINTKKIISSFSHRNDFLAQPRWISDNEIILVAVNQDGNQLLRLNTENGEWVMLLNAYDINISRPFAYQNKIYFSSGLTGIENIFELELETKNVSQITNTRFGAFDPFVLNDTLYFSNYDVNGYEIWKTSLKKSLNKTVLFPQHPVSNSLPQYFKNEAKASIDSLIRIDTTYNTFFWNKLFSPTGWFPLVFPPELGVEFNTLNLERTFKATIGINYNFKEDIIQTRFTSSYAKLFPIINGTMLKQARRIKQSLPVYSDSKLPEIRTAETILGIGLAVPLNLTQGIYYTNLLIKSELNHHDVKYLEDDLDNLIFNSLVTEVDFSRLRPKALRQVQTPFGQNIYFHYKHGLENYDPTQLYINGQFYFPSVFKTHSLNFEVAYEQNKYNSSYNYLSPYQGSRGYQYYPFNESFALSANYELPLLYPDSYIGGLVGLTRVRFNAFMDYSSGITSNFEQKQRSFGGEFIFDLRLFRAFNMNLKLQLAKRLDAIGEQKPFFLNIAVDYFELLN